MGPLLLLLAIYVLAVARLSRIVTTDKIGEPVRAWALRQGPLIGYAAHCDWCLGWWVAGALAFPVAAVGGLPWWWGFGLWPACSYLVGLLSRFDQN